MAESPFSWGPLEKAVDEGIDRFNEMMADPDLYGPSMQATIADVIREKGLYPCSSSCCVSV